MTQPPPPVTQPSPRPSHTLRLTFAYDGDKVSLVRTQRVAMIAPPSVTEPPRAGKHSGFWLEVRDAHGRILFHRVLHNPIRYLAEVHMPDRSIRAVTGEPGKGEFEVLIPDIPEASSIVLFGSPLDLKRSLEPAKELATFRLKQ